MQVFCVFHRCEVDGYVYEELQSIHASEEAAEKQRELLDKFGLDSYDVVSWKVED